MRQLGPSKGRANQSKCFAFYLPFLATHLIVKKHLQITKTCTLKWMRLSKTTLNNQPIYMDKRGHTDSQFYSILCTTLREHPTYHIKAPEYTSPRSCVLIHILPSHPSDGAKKGNYSPFRKARQLPMTHSPECLNCLGLLPRHLARS